MRHLFPIRSFLIAAALGLATFASLAGERPYDAAAFDAALAAKQPVIVDFAADWCPTCRAQKPIVAALLAEPKRRPITLFVADYDTEKALKKRLRITQQSSFVVFKDGREVGRSTGQTDRAEIAALFDRAL